jgi:hypothetical protein
MDIPRKDLEILLESLQPAALSQQTLDRMERSLAPSTDLDVTDVSMEKQCKALVPQALSATSFDRLFDIVQHVPFAIDEKVVLFPGTTKTKLAVSSRRSSILRRYWAAAAVALLGGLAALLSPPVSQDPFVSQTSQPAATIPMAPSNEASSPKRNSGIVATSYGSGMERAADEGVIWTQDRQPCRVLRFQYQDRVLVRDQNGIDRMLFIPREELYVVPEKCD